MTITTIKQTPIVLLLLIFFWTSCSLDNEQNSGEINNSQDTKNQKENSITAKENTLQQSTQIKDSNAFRVNTDSIATLTNITNFLTAQTENFIIDSTQDTLIKCKKGTVVFLPANSLQHQDGTSPKGNVHMMIKECYSIADFLGDNLTTISGDKILETGGMIQISISDNGRPLQIKEENEYALYFPKNKRNGEMQLFYGVSRANEPMDWKLSSVSEFNQSTKINETSLIDKLEYTCKLSITGHTTSIDDVDVEWKMKNGNQTIANYFSNNFSIPENLNQDFCNQNNRLELDLKLNDSGNVSDITFDKSFTPEIDKIISDFFYALPPLDISTMAKHSTKQKYSLIIRGRTVIDRDKYNSQFKQKYASFKDKAITKIDKAELNYFVLTASKLGWINCDRFYNSDAEKIDFIVKANSIAETKILIAFKSINSVMQGKLENDKIVFSNIPINQEIKIIGISCHNGKPTLGIAETKTNKNGFQLNSFNEFSLNELESELNTLN